MRKYKNRLWSLVLLLAIFFTNTELIYAKEAIFKDEKDISKWAYESVIRANKENIISGYQDGNFRPKNNISRAEFTSIVVRALDLELKGSAKKFKDVGKNDWHRKFIDIATSNDIISGYQDGNFRPNKTISREEMAVIISNAMELKNNNPIYIKDKKTVSKWALPYVERVVNEGLILGDNFNFRPKNKTTREMTAAVALRMVDSKNMSGEDFEKSLDMSKKYLKNKVENPQVSSIGGEWSVLALARAEDLDEKIEENYLQNLKTKLDITGGVLHKTRSTEYSRVIMALKSIDKSADNIYSYDLYESLKDYDFVKAQGINGPIFALIALNNFELDKAYEDKLIDAVMERELKSGGWSFSKEDDLMDVDITAMAIQALSKHRSREDVKLAIDRAVKALSKLQNKKGGYESWGSDNSENISQVIIALTSVGIDPLKDERFIKNGNSLISRLIEFQDKSTGGFYHVFGDEPNLMASEQAALAMVSYDRFKSGESHIYDM